MQILSDSSQRWHVSIAHSLLIPNVLKKIRLYPQNILSQPHEGVESIDTFKCKNITNIQYIKNTYSGQSMYAYM